MYVDYMFLVSPYLLQDIHLFRPKMVSALDKLKRISALMGKAEKLIATKLYQLTIEQYSF